MAEGGKIRLRFEHDGRVARLTLSAPKANIVDAAMIGELEAALETIEKRQGLRAVVLDAEGPHFSFGASVEEHLPEAIRGALERLHHLVRRLHEIPAPTIAAVRGQCLGGGFELVLSCDLVLAEASAKLGLPEITLGVFAPAGSALLPARIGGGGATNLLLSGRAVGGEEARALRVVQRVTDPGGLEDALQAWLEEDFLGRSAAGLRHAALAARRPRKRAIEEDLPAIESAYLEQLMAVPDGAEGIRAFLEKRDPCWTEVATE